MTAPRAVRPVLDVAGLPNHAFGHHGLPWWGTMGIVVIEGLAFALVIASYLYVWSQVPDWPMGVPLPDATLGTVNVLILLASALPN